MRSFVDLDATFEGQREAAIKEHEAGLTLIRAHISKTPTAISIDPGYAEELWVKDGRFEDIVHQRNRINLGGRIRNVESAHHPSSKIDRQPKGVWTARGRWDRESESPF